MKTCSCCHTEKPYSDFYETSSKCKECIKAYNLEYKKLINGDPVKRAEMLRQKREYGKVNRWRWEPDPQTARDYRRRYLDKYPEKRAAHRAVQKALKSGRLVRQPCEKCGKSPTHAHHDDHRKKLDVRWLCREHHEDFHHGTPICLDRISGISLKSCYSQVIWEGSRPRCPVPRIPPQTS